MRTIIYIFIGFSISFMIVTRISQKDIIKNQEKIIVKLDSINNHHLHNDSLYREHLRECSFVSSEQISFDKNGYAYLNNDKPWEFN